MFEDGSGAFIGMGGKLECTCDLVEYAAIPFSPGSMYHRNIGR